MSPLESMLMRHEGVKLKRYVDTKGISTIGIGRNLDDAGISMDEAMLLLNNDIAKATDYSTSVFPWFSALSDARKAVVVSLVFNLGMGGVMAFKKFLSAMSVGDWATAKNELQSSVWASQVGTRAVELADMVESGLFISAV